MQREQREAQDAARGRVSDTRRRRLKNMTMRTTIEHNTLPYPTAEAYLEATQAYMEFQLERLERLHKADPDLLFRDRPDSLLSSGEMDVSEFRDFQLTYALKSKATSEAGFFSTFIDLIPRLGLKKFQVHCVMLALSCSASGEFARRMETLGLAVSGKPSVRGAVLLYRIHDALTMDACFFADLERVFSLFFLRESSAPNVPAAIHLETLFALNPQALAYLTNTPMPLPYYLTFYPSGKRNRNTPIKSDAALLSESERERLFSAWERRPEHSMVLLFGEPGGGKKTLYKDYCDAMGRNMIFADCHLLSLMKEIDLSDAFRQMEIAAALYNACICLCGVDTPKGAPLVRHVMRLSRNGISLLATAESDYPEAFSRVFTLMTVPLPAPSSAQRMELWSHALPLRWQDALPLSELSGKFKMTPGQIEAAVQEASFLNQESITSAEMAKCCYHQSLADLSENAERINAVFTWEDLVLPEDLLARIQQSCNHVKLRSVVFDQWNFSSRFSYGVGVNILFAGPPGTGKTMAAQVIANDLEMELYRIDLSAVVSKYVGETEKNLNQVFENAKNSNVILFFDEMDALFGKRGNTKEAKDKYANMETAFLLQKIEEYEGVVLMATNYLMNIDEAFFRRIHFIFHIPFPDETARKTLWRKNFPSKAPLKKNVDFDYLAKNFEISGAVIKNIAVSAAFLAAAQNQEISMKHILKAAKLELSKQGKILLNRQDFGQYAFLLEGDALYDEG